MCPSARTSNAAQNGSNSVGDTNGLHAINGRYGSIRIETFETHDLRFPTSLDQSGSDAMNPAGDYSSSYIILKTNHPELSGHGFAFTIGRGNELTCAAAALVAERLVGMYLENLTSNMGETWRYLVSDSQLRWIGPEKGVIHLGTSACVNALWDLWARALGKPVWQLVCDMAPEELVSCIDFRYIVDAVTPEEAVEIIRAQVPSRPARLQEASLSSAVPAYSTQAGWLGFGDAKMRKLMEDMLDIGIDKFKLKVGISREDDRRRMKIAREVLGPDRMLMVDANQVWNIPEAIDWMIELAEFNPAFIEEPTSPDDILGHATIRRALKPYNIGVATGEHCQNRVMFKQLLQADAIDVCQIDACRLGGVNEVLSVLLMAKKFGVPVIPHSGGIGLNEYTQHLALIDYICFSGRKGLLEHIDSFNSVIYHPVKVLNGHFVTPQEIGYSVEYRPEAIATYRYPNGTFWQSSKGQEIRAGVKR